MSCGCGTSHDSTRNCGNCGNGIDCSCVDRDDPRDVLCPNPEPCDELYPAECVIYRRDAITCTTGAVLGLPMHPTVNPVLAITGDRLDHQILQNINKKFCYIFSEAFIAQLLLDIRNTPALCASFATNVCQCGCGASNIVGPSNFSVTMS